MKYTERERDILRIVADLDISPTMFKNATEKYKSIADFLVSNGIDAEFYAQGSFALGTVVKPYRENDDGGYDLDAICKLYCKKNELSARELFTKVAELFKESERYKDKITIYDKCITVNYADINGVPFSIDIVPAVDDDVSYKAIQGLELNNADIASTIIAIPKHNNANYSWFSNNPKGYKKWFDNINETFIKYASVNRESIFESHRGTFASIEEVPADLERSALQQVIQILKRSRDIYYSNIPAVNKPISAIISTLAANIAKTINPTASTFELLRVVISELNIYSLQTLRQEYEFATKYSGYDLILRKDGKWYLPNPALPDDNLTDSWTDNDAKTFFMWVSGLEKDFNEYEHIESGRFRTGMENVFGAGAVANTLNEKYRIAKPTVYIPETSPKPWRI